MEVTTEFDDGEGNLDLWLCTSEDCEYTSSSNVDKSAAGTAARNGHSGRRLRCPLRENELYMSWSGGDALEQDYIMTIKPIGRPAECSSDIGEPVTIQPTGPRRFPWTNQ